MVPQNAGVISDIEHVELVECGWPGIPDQGVEKNDRPHLISDRIRIDGSYRASFWARYDPPHLMRSEIRCDNASIESSKVFGW